MSAEILSDDVSSEVLDRTFQIMDIHGICYDYAVQLAYGNITDEEIIRLKVSESIGSDLEPDILRERNELEAGNLIEDLKNNKCNISMENAIAFVSINSGNRQMLCAKYLLITDLKKYGGYIISNADAEEFISSNPTYSRDEMCAMYILVALESKYDNQGNASGGNAMGGSSSIRQNNVHTEDVAINARENANIGHSEWECTACTFVNHKELNQCEICEKPK